MPHPKVLVFSGSIRTGSFNQRLASLAAKELARAEAEVSMISLADYPMPIYDGDLEANSGPPASAVNLKRMMCAHDGIFIASPEYNASITPLLKNSLDWVSRVRENKEPPLAAFKNRVFALGAASPGTLGGMRSLMALRQVLELGCGALVIPDQIAIREANQAFDDMDNLKDERSANLLRALAQRLVELAWQRVSVP
ncbi:MAG TPA: NAD(P)H-dependent oxidoreductase [Xanthobacteraceae bacterium]|jgi:NAD(P)H-dependent FMN reductase|nr:NAD(P)H-dependent oxidoreductase [Xanthobacteraceae bacterium]